MWATGNTREGRVHGFIEHGTPESDLHSVLHSDAISEPPLSASGSEAPVLICPALELIVGGMNTHICVSETWTLLVTAVQCKVFNHLRCIFCG